MSIASKNKTTTIVNYVANKRTLDNKPHFSCCGAISTCAYINQTLWYGQSYSGSFSTCDCKGGGNTNNKMKAFSWACALGSLPLSLSLFLSLSSFSLSPCQKEIWKSLGKGTHPRIWWYDACRKPLSQHSVQPWELFLPKRGKHGTNHVSKKHLWHTFNIQSCLTAQLFLQMTKTQGKKI